MLAEEKTKAESEGDKTRTLADAAKYEKMP